MCNVKLPATLPPPPSLDISLSSVSEILTPSPSASALLASAAVSRLAPATVSRFSECSDRPTLSKLSNVMRTLRIWEEEGKTHSSVIW